MIIINKLTKIISAYLNMELIDKIRISHSAITDFNNCPRLYYFKSIYRNPKTGNRVQIVNPYLSLGLAVHETIDELIDIAPSKRVNKKLSKRFEKIWQNYSGKIGGFTSKKQEEMFKKRGHLMIKKIEGSAILSKRSLKKEKDFPKIELSDDMNLIGNFDWIELMKDGSLHIIDFKTGKSKEKNDSLQLPIYQVLAEKNYNRKVKKLSYWYLEKDTKLTTKKIISTNKCLDIINKKANEIKNSIESRSFGCSSKYRKCFYCKNYETILSGKAEYLGTKNERDLYYLANSKDLLDKIYEESFLDKKEKEIVCMKMNNITMDETRETLNISKIEIKKSVESIKIKLKENLEQKELKIFIEELLKKENKFDA